MAKELAAAVGADIHEIIHAQLYTSADLDRTNRKSRSSVEMSGRSFRPAAANREEDISQNDVVFVGFPVRWYVAQMIINTFPEQYDLSGKKTVPFAASDGSASAAIV